MTISFIMCLGVIGDCHQSFSVTSLFCWVLTWIGTNNTRRRMGNAYSFLVSQ